MKTTFIALLAFSLCLPLAGAEKKTDVEKAGYKGRVKSVKVSSFDIEQIDGKLVRTGLVFPGENITKYDEKGNMLEEVRYGSSGKIRSKSTYIYKYNEKGNKVEEVRYGSNDDTKSKGTYKYDDKGNKVEEAVYTASGKLDSKRTYKYDENENLVETLTYDASGKVTLKNSTKYDKKGNKVKKTSYDFFLPTEFFGNEQTWEFTYWD